MLGVQGVVKTKTKWKKTDTTKLVFENLWHKISFEKDLNFVVQRKDLRLSGRECQYDAAKPAQWPVSLQRFEEEAEMMEMHTSWAKTKIQNCTSLCQTIASVNVEGNSVQITQKFRYLDCDIHSSGYSSPKSPKSWACLIHLWPMRLCLEEQTHQAHNQAEGIYNLCPPRPTYGSEKWTLRADDTGMLQAFTLRCQRRILGVRWS